MTTKSESERDDLTGSEVSILDALIRIQSEYISKARPEEVFDHILEELLRFTGSEFGLIAEVGKGRDDQPVLKATAIAATGEDNNVKSFIDQRTPDEVEIACVDTLFGKVVASREPVIANSLDLGPGKGHMPEGHPRLVAFLGLPLAVGERLLGVVAVANHPGGYDGHIVNSLKPVADACANLINATRLEQKRLAAEQALRENEARYKALVDNAIVGIFRFPLGGGYPLAANETAAAIFGYSNVDDFRAYFNLSDRFAVAGEWDRFRETLDRFGQARSFQTRMKHRDGYEILVELAVNLFWGRGYMEGAVLDITDRKRGEDEQRAVEARLQQSQKLESLGVLAGGIAHDFNNLLMAISGNAELALLCGELEDARAHVKAIGAATRRASELSSKILAFTGRGRLSCVNLDLSDALARSVSLFESVVHRNINLEFGLQPHLPDVNADEDQICQVLVNLISNSSEAIGDQPGRITVSTSMAECSRELLAGTYVDDDLPAGAYLRLQVTDNGPGMSETTRSRMFEPFFTTNQFGRGLGLASTLGIVRSHRGAIAVESETGCGCVATIYLPTCATTPADTVVAREEEETWRGSGTVLLVDDEEMVRVVVGGLLRKLGFEVLGARNGSEAVHVFARHASRIDLILLDLQMPVMDGVEAFFRLREISPTSKIVLCSGYDERTATEHLVGEGLAGFIQKPYVLSVLRDKIREILNS